MELNFSLPCLPAWEEDNNLSKRYVITWQSPEGFWANETLNFETNLTNLTACEAEGRSLKGKDGRIDVRLFWVHEWELERYAEKEKGGKGDTEKGLHIFVVGRPIGSLQVQPMSWTCVEKLQLSIIVGFKSRSFSISSSKP